MAERLDVFTVAVVDDDRRVLESLENLLASAGHEVRLFASAKALLESPDLARVHCLISDIGMPGMDGFELQRVLHGVRPELPIIFVTAYSEWIGKARADSLRHYGLFQKPFNGLELLAAVNRALRDSSPGG